LKGGFPSGGYLLSLGSWEFGFFQDIRFRDLVVGVPVAEVMGVSITFMCRRILRVFVPVPFAVRMVMMM
jgi:hypothetical protein